MPVSGGHASGPAVVIVSLLFTVLAVIASALRLYTRIVIGRNGGYDDFFITIATFLSVGLTVCTCLEIRYGDGQHEWTISQAEATRSLQALYASIIIYNLALFTCKASILLQYLRIFPQRDFRIACFALMGFSIAYVNWSFWSQVFFCKPIAAYWDLEMTDGKCFDRGLVWFMNAGINIVSDIAVAALPLPMLKQLRIQRRPKIALMVVFGLGGFTCIVSILRLESIYAASHSLKDTSYNSSLAALWSSLEVNTGILCSSLPTLKTLLSRLFPQIFTSYHRSTLPSAGPNNNTLDPSNKPPTFGSKPHRKPHHRTGMTHDQISRGGGIMSERGGQHAAFASRGSRGGSMEIDLTEMLGSPPRGGGGGAAARKEIKVVTVVNQEVEVEGGLTGQEGIRMGRGGDGGMKSETGSTRDLIWRTSSEEDLR
ncbi:hypothetical protein LTR91_006437 [Friedmanniomyces endolithicus]|uniref:Rhodopsin domain-containing protein n=1 Tax=Friedmanniomyces endolithicus TaxID=329885 RepID=A0AAN6KST6_9PEZI|nr:hypothetical protein LTR94_005781 [Friedmanniomyces endolithicus]KAK0776119.1 hypothetical protein LTR59_014311 [Friedmanniomyces endolithicus]KAK0777375.1 hypothetical protein LTR38_015175 [Friedmanniomyces endolithicus]KAK0785645.1 hypothetical protein LTR75_013454 [Friedmanniomyces endolithicus]KAK0850460.1 hypothetical protein LTS02_013189 [Friedmanniomyces endolithicus]